MTQRRPDPRRPRTRRSILESARLLFTAQSIEATTIAQVSAHAGVAIGSIYSHFGSKENLVIELLVHVSEPRFEALEASRAGRTPLDRVAAVGEAIMQLAIDEPVAFLAGAGGLLLSNDLVSEGPGSTLVHWIETVGDHLRDDLQLAIDAGDLPPGDVGQLVALRLALWTGIATSVARQDRFAVDVSVARGVLAQGSALLQ